MSEAAAPVLYCSFCGKPQAEVFVLIAAPSAYICDECILTCSAILKDRVRDRIAQIKASSGEPA
jgi:ATP-dependent Clp protease ATP-binding subunit ClpX